MMPFEALITRLSLSIYVCEVYIILYSIQTFYGFTMFYPIHPYTYWNSNGAAQGGGGSFKDGEP